MNQHRVPVHIYSIPSLAYDEVTDHMVMYETRMWYKLIDEKHGGTIRFQANGMFNDAINNAAMCLLAHGHEPADVEVTILAMPD